MNEDRKQQYFAELAPRYSAVTGNATQDIFEKFLDIEDLHISGDSIIHDNAAGPGTATQVLVQHVQIQNGSPSIVATDYAPGMIETLELIKAAEFANSPGWAKVSSAVVNSADLSRFGDEYFTHSINNFSLFTITDAVQSLRETRRTLKSGSLAVVILWKRFAIEAMLIAAQDAVKGVGYAIKNAVPLNGPQYFQEGVVESQLVEAGFDRSKMRTSVIQHFLGPTDVAKRAGLQEFMTSTSVAAGSTRGWTEEEVQKWPDAVRQAIEKEDEAFGGIKFEAWVTIAQK